ncbi:hypothetical protein ILUMI_01400 [Ignelater luminosus]|uniref:Reverse transcriptase Ty1/copia-type domain-containing protein n=1 Tax=Ignelater luminosus TaxID=2038154 RepID=A0A8K0DEG6_IGNLU|nr:hypothetical protein ILUMI_01400 [Ignelater luminosus]
MDSKEVHALRDKKKIKKSTRFEEFDTSFIGISELTEPLTFSETIANKEADKWNEAIAEEMKKQEVEKLKSILKSTFRMTDMRRITNYLRININQAESTTKMNQMAYLEEILKYFRMYDCKLAPTPLQPNPRKLLEASNKKEVENRVKD